MLITASTSVGKYADAIKVSNLIQIVFTLIRLIYFGSEPNS